MVTVGMNDFAVKLLGCVNSISLPKKGSKARQGACGWRMNAESRAIHMLSPIEGEVVAVNEKVIDSPALAFNGPYGRSWLFIKVRNANLTPNLKNMVPVAMVGDWFENIRKTLACRQTEPAVAGPCQDGGEPVRGLATAGDSKGWDDLAREFCLQDSQFSLETSIEEKGVNTMAKVVRISSRLAGMIVGLVLMVVGLGFMVLGISLLPVVGIMVGVPILAIARKFIAPRRIELGHIADAPLVMVVPRCLTALISGGFDVPRRRNVPSRSLARV